MAAKKFTYLWKGIQKGQKVAGEITGNNPSVLKTQLRRQRIVVHSFKKQTGPLFGSRGGKKITNADIAAFTRQMSTMLKAGVPLTQSLGMVADGLKHPALQKLINSLEEEVASGTPFATALAKHPRYFDSLYCNLIEAGEQAGALETLLARVATYKEKAEQLKKKIKKALTYPMAVLAIAGICTGVLLVKVVPQFAETFGSFGAELPAFTQFVLGISESLQASWYLYVAAMAGLGFAHRECIVRSRKYVEMVDRSIIKMPVIGEILYNGVVARFARTLATTFAAGVPLVEALESVSGAAGNVIYTRGILKIQEEVTGGIPLNVAMRTSELFPPLALQMTMIGEESGTLDEMLERVATHYEAAVDDSVDNLTALLEPMIMGVLAIVVGGILIAMYLPIFALGSVV